VDNVITLSEAFLLVLMYPIYLYISIKYTNEDNNIVVMETHAQKSKYFNFSN